MYLRELSRSKFHSVTSSNVILCNDVKNSIFIKSGFNRFWKWALQLAKEHLCPVTCMRLHYKSVSIINSMFFGINYANEAYLHRGRVFFRLKSVIITRYTHANLKIDKKNMPVMIDFSREPAIICANV